MRIYKIIVVIGVSQKKVLMSEIELCILEEMNKNISVFKFPVLCVWCDLICVDSEALDCMYK